MGLVRLQFEQLLTCLRRHRDGAESVSERNDRDESLTYSEILASSSVLDYSGMPIDIFSRRHPE